jgi:hypothetical protein
VVHPVDEDSHAHRLHISVEPGEDRPGEFPVDEGVRTGRAVGGDQGP